MVELNGKRVGYWLIAGMPLNCKDRQGYIHAVCMEVPYTNSKPLEILKSSRTIVDGNGNGNGNGKGNGKGVSRDDYRLAYTIIFKVSRTVEWPNTFSKSKPP